MNVIAAARITESVRRLFMDAAVRLPDDVMAALRQRRAEEDWAPARSVLDQLIRNDELAVEEEMPICQDTGMAVVWMQIGQDVHIEGDLTEAVNEGVRQGYNDGYLRKSIVLDPLRRANTGDNTPAALITDIVPGDSISLTCAPKGFGCENMSRLAMLSPSAGLDGVKSFVLDTVRKAGPNACPPLVVGVGIGGSFDRVAWLARRALLIPLDEPHPDPFYAALEQELLSACNALGIGPHGLGGRSTLLGLRIQTAPTHIASLPVAVNINCHAARHASEVIR